MTLTTDLRDELRTLQRNGWTITKTSKGHWRCTHPDTDQVIFMSGTPSDWRAAKNFRAKINRALRATPEETTMMHPSLTAKDIKEAVVPKTGLWTPEIRVYRSPAEGTGQPFVELLFGSREALHMGGVGARVRVWKAPGDGWRLEPDQNGDSKILLTTSEQIFRIRSRTLADVIPPTGRTSIPAEVNGNGFILHPELVEPVPSRLTGMALPPAKAPPRAPVAAPAKPAKPAVLAKSASLDDLRTALEMLRTIAGELGAELYMADGQLRARVVTVL